MRIRQFSLALLLISALCSGPLHARQEGAAAAPPATAPAGTDQATEEEDEAPAHKVARPKPLTIVETIAARVDSARNEKIRIEMDQWTDLEVLEAIPQGTPVRAGDVVLRFKLDDFEKRMAEARIDLKLAEIGAAIAKANLDYSQRTSDLDREIAESSWNETREDHRFWMEVRKPLAIESSQRSLRNSEFAVEYAQEELNQLEKMYAEDELTEESEKIVLERTRRELEDTQFWLKRNRIETDRDLTVDIPREEESQKRNLLRGELEYNKSMIEIPAGRQRAELEFEKSRLEHEKEIEEFRKLEEDFAKMVVRSPSDGVVYHGEIDRGKWSNQSGSRLRQIEPRDELSNNSVIMTVVDPADLRLRCDLTEAQAAAIRPGQRAFVTIAALPGQRFEATVESVSRFPVVDDDFDCVLRFSRIPEGLRPGMAGEVKLVVYERADALLVPKSAVFSDNEDISHYMFVLADDKPVRREVTVGREHDDHWEIVSGLAAGEKFLESRPDEDDDE